VAAEFLRKLLGQPAPPAPEVAEARAELDRLARERPALAGPAGVLRDLLPDLVPDPPPLSLPPLTPDQARAKRAGGVPLLRGEALAPDTAAVRRRWRRACALLSRQPGGAPARALAAALRRGSLNLEALTRDALAGQPEAVHARAEALGLDAGLTATVLRLGLLPALAPVQAALAPLADGTAWEHGYCPACGSWPLLGEYRGLEQRRVLRCGLCAAEWGVPRLLCPFCGTRDHRLLGYFSVEGEEGRYRATTCDGCRGYVKMTATLQPLAVLQLLVADVATLHLDLAAAERGFAAGLGGPEPA
jgi:FdhE protein